MNAKLNDIVTRAFNETWRVARSATRACATAAYGLAVQRVAEATVDARPLPVAEPRVTLYHAAGLPPLRARARRRRDVRAASCEFELEEVDITGDAELEARYREWLPVVEIDGERAFVYYVDRWCVSAQSAGTNSARLNVLRDSPTALRHTSRAVTS